MPQNVQAPVQAIEGTFLIHDRPRQILFDTGASHSFVSRNFVALSGMLSQPCEQSLAINTPLGDHTILQEVCKGVTIEISGLKFLTELLVLDMESYDVILGMDWLSQYHAQVNYHDKSIVFAIPGQEMYLITMFRSKGGASTYLFYIEEGAPEEATALIHSTPIVQEF